MDVTYTITGTTTATATTGTAFVSTPGSFLQLYSGMDLVSANYIVSNGLNFQKMKEYSQLSHAFWATKKAIIARTYARLSPVVVMQGGVEAIFCFKLPIETIEFFKAPSQGLVGEDEYDAAFYFLPPIFDVISSQMTFKAAITVENFVFEE